MDSGYIHYFRTTFGNNKYAIGLLAVYAFLLLFFCSQMSPLYPINYWCDANIYFNMGKAMFEGRTLYAEGFDHKGPLIFIIYGFGYLISNSSFLGVFIIELIFWMAMLWAVYFTAKQFLSSSYSILVALIFPLLILKYTVQGGSAEEFILALNTVSLLFFVRYFKNSNSKPVHNPRFMLIHGITSGMAFFIKLNLILFWFFPLLVIFIYLLIRKEYRNFIYNLASYFAGFLLIATPIIIYFIYYNALDTAYSIYIVLNSQYASIPPTVAEKISLLLHRIYLFAREDLLSTVAIGMGIVYFPIKYMKNNYAKVAFYLSGISLFIIISITRSFFGYYNLPFFVFSTLGWIVIMGYIERHLTVVLPRKVVNIVFLILICLGITQKHFFGVGGDSFFKRSGVTGVVEQFGNTILQDSNPTLLNLGFGEASAIFTYCNITPNVTYFVIPNIPYSLYPKMRDEQTIYLKEKRTDFVIVSNASMDYEYFKDLPELHDNYELVDKYIDTNTYLTDEFWTSYLYKARK